MTRSFANKGARRALSLLAGLTAWLCLAAPAAAQVCTPSFPTLNFGSVNVLTGAQVDIASTIVVSCTGIPGGFRVRACLALNDGDVAPFDATWRQMASGANRLRFSIFRNAAYTQRWGNTGAQIVAMTITTGAPSVSRAIYARIQNNQQTASVGSYLNNMDGMLRYVLFANGATAPNCATVVANPTPIAFQVRATVAASCSVSATNLNFGTVGVIAANVDASSQITVRCTTNAPYSVALNGGLTGATNPALRKMANGANQITYGLYRDAPRSLVWGSTAGVDTLNATGSSVNQLHTVYGRIPPQTTPAPGVYSDTIIVTVSF